MKREEVAGPTQYFAPLLDALKELGGSGTPDEVVDRIAQDLKLSPEVQSDLLDSGEPRYRNQVRWARMFLVREGYIDSSERGVWRLTPEGLKTTLNLQTSKEIYQKWNRIFAEKRGKKNKDSDAQEIAPDGTGQTSYDYRSKIIELLTSLSPSGFERFSQLLLRNVGFTQVVVTGRAGDGGIDGYGTLQVNELVSFKVLFQCKKYKGSTSAGQIRDFRGALGGRSDKGIFLTTGSFTSDARREATRDGVPPVELIDGEKLVDLLCKYKLGVNPITTFEIDEQFFSQFQT